MLRFFYYEHNPEHHFEFDRHDHDEPDDGLDDTPDEHGRDYGLDNLRAYDWGNYIYRYLPRDNDGDSSYHSDDPALD